MDTEDDIFAQNLHRDFEMALASAAPELVLRPSFSASAMACILTDKNDVPFWSDTKFENWIGQGALDTDLSAKVRSSGKDCVVHIADHHGRPILLVYAPGRSAENWPVRIPPSVKTAMTPGCLAIGALSLANLADDLFFKARALGLSNLEARIAAALVTHGNVRRAAAQCSVTYNTARSAVSDALKKTGTPNQTRLVRKLSALSTSISPPRETAEQVLIDIFGLSLREARLTLLLTEGHSRNVAAKIAGLSKSVAKDSYSQIFEKTGVSKLPELPRIVMDAFTAALLVKLDRAIVPAHSARQTPLRLFQRDDGGLIAVSDYGPAEGAPVLILHSSLSTRRPFRKLVKALQTAGYRPITMDRPGFGLSDNLSGPNGEEDDPFSAGAQDIALVCETLKIDKLHMITRGGAFSALAAARLYPELVGRVVIINPDLLQHHCSKRHGSFGIIRTGFDKFPQRIEGVARWAAAQLSEGWTDKLIRYAVRDSPPDRAIFTDPEVIEDYRKSIMVFGSGRISGFVREQRGYALCQDVAPLADAKNWRLLIGETDPIHEISDILKFWKTKAPGAKILRPKGAGRFISLTHTEDVIAALAAPN